MSRSKSSGRWLREHEEDEYVQRARKEGLRSRAVYKLKELDQRYGVFRKGMGVLDLGAAPGGWAQYAVSRVGAEGQVVATDILPIEPIEGVEFIQGDFREQGIIDQILGLLSGASLDLVTSDMAPNISGIKAVDVPRAMYLVELAHDMANRVLCPGGSFICKLFQGEGSDAWLRDLRRGFTSVVVKKPKASRPRSREVYVLARGFKA